MKRVTTFLSGVELTIEARVAKGINAPTDVSMQPVQVRSWHLVAEL